MGRSDGQVMQGVALVVAATLLFALSDAISKHLALLYAVPLIMAVRSFATLGILGGLQGPRIGRGLWQTQRTGLVMLRGLCLAAASLTMGLALRVMPLGETVAIIYLSPFAVMLLSGPILHEKVSPVAWVAAVIAFCGVLLIARPGSGLDPVGVMLALMNAAFATSFNMMTRALSRTETATAMTFFTAVVGALVFCGLLVITPPTVLPDLPNAGLMVLLGVLATGGHFLFANAYRFASAATLAPVNYMHLVWAGILGWLVFQHSPDGLTIIGMALVISGGALGALRARRRAPA